MNSITSKDRQLLEDQASRRKRKTTVFLFFIILFTIIIGSIVSVFIALKQEADAESLSASSPEVAIKAVCDLTPSPTTCFSSTWSLQTNFSTTTNLAEIKTTPSRIFTLSLRAAANQLLDLISENEIAISKAKDSRTLTVLKSCDVFFKDSSRLINASITAMGVNPDDKIFKVANSVSRIKVCISNSTENIKKCLIGLGDDHEGLKIENHDVWTLRAKIVDSRRCVDNSLVMLEKMDKILGMFNQPMFAGIIDYDFRRLRYDFGMGMVLYCLQYWVLIVFICMVLRL